MQLATTLKVALPKLVQDYLDQNEDLADCYRFDHTIEGVLSAAKDRIAQDRNYEVLCSVLNDQAKASKFSSKQTFSNIERIKSGAVTITTGHQLCIYGGPLFFFHKILSIVALCKQLEERGIDAIPVYWMASEDHDFEEINHVFIENEKITWNSNQAGPVGKFELNDLSSFQEKLRAIYQADPLKKDALSKLERIFRPERNLAQAMTDFVYSIFADLGVIVLNADHVELKALFAPLAKEELNNQVSFNALVESNQKLESKGYKIQVEGRETNLFYMTKGYRERIIKTDAGFTTADGKMNWTAQEMLALVDSNPEMFSPNVILRPVYQELILPNAAYVGGPGELSYWLQLLPVFDAFKVFYPTVLLRDMILISDLKTQKRMQQLEFSYQETKEAEDELLKKIVRRSGSHEFIVEHAMQRISKQLDEMLHELANLNQNLKVSGESERTRITKRLETLRKKVLRHDKNQAEVASKRIEEVKLSLYPLKTPQERISNWLNFTSNPVFWINELVPFYNLFEIGAKIIEETTSQLPIKDH